MKREEKARIKRQAILDAALKEFSRRGFDGARMEDVARDAGVGKGTLYLYFKDKAALFAAIPDEVLAPMHTFMLDVLAQEHIPLRERLWRMAQPILEENGRSRVGRAIRLIHAEGLHNPHLIRPYLLLVCNTLRCMQSHMRAAGLPDALCAHPQLLMGPLLHGVNWQGLAYDIAPLDMAGMFRTHLDGIFGAEGAV